MSEITKEEIIQAINEWPIEESVPEYCDVTTDRVHNPSSVSSFFLRHVGRKDKATVVTGQDSLDEESEDHIEELSADVSIAKWWKQTGHTFCADLILPNSSNPQTIINFVARTEDGASYIQREIRRLRTKLSKGSKNVSVLSALSSFYEKQGNLSLAKLHLETLLEKNPEDKECKWRFRRLKRAIQHRQAQEDALRNIDHNSTSTCRKLPTPSQVKKIKASDLSLSEFFFNYALKSQPVVITDFVEKMTSVPWTLQHIQDIAGDCKVSLKKSVRDSVQWARLEDSSTKTVTEFILGILDNEAQQKEYLFDWSLPLHCPKLAQEITIPKYFAGDFLQRTSQGSYYQDSWPSLFIAPKGIQSDLHVDAFGSNFWMALFQGQKRWTFFPREDMPLLYPEYSHPWSSDPVFQADLQTPDLTLHPLLVCTSPVQCVLQPGELLFVPAGCPHTVENLDTSLAISSNFVDLSNLDLVKEELTLTSLIDDRSHDLLKQLSDQDFPTSMSSDIDHMPWEKFKSWNKIYCKNMDITSDSVNKLREMIHVK